MFNAVKYNSVNAFITSDNLPLCSKLFSFGNFSFLDDLIYMYIYVNVYIYMKLIKFEMNHINAKQMRRLNASNYLISFIALNDDVSYTYDALRGSHTLRKLRAALFVKMNLLFSMRIHTPLCYNSRRGPYIIYHYITCYLTEILFISCKMQFSVLE